MGLRQEERELKFAQKRFSQAAAAGAKGGGGGGGADAAAAGAGAARKAGAAALIEAARPLALAILAEPRLLRYIAASAPRFDGSGCASSNSHVPKDSDSLRHLL